MSRRTIIVPKARQGTARHIHADGTAEDRAAVIAADGAAIVVVSDVTLGEPVREDHANGRWAFDAGFAPGAEAAFLAAVPGSVTRDGLPPDWKHPRDRT